jgi:phosphoribosylformylglycinamidine cyclo-ligase
MGDRYRQAGVDIDASNAAKAAIREHVRATFGPAVVGGLGGFGGLYAFQGSGQSVLVSSADSVGTKVLLACTLERHDTVGADLVNHCVNDILACGARPLFFLDYLGAGRVDPGRVEQIVAGLAAACRANDCALVGGETAELPGLYQPDHYDLAGFIVGTVERDSLIDGARVRAGDVLLGLPSSGLHTNGYSLARAALGLTGDPARDRLVLERYETVLGGTVADALMAVHRSYLAVVWPLLTARLARGIAHITGGGLIENVPRTLPDGLAARFDARAWMAPPIFDYLARAGQVARAEMYRVFNMGMGMVLVCAPEDVAAAQALAPDVVVVGEVVAAVKNRERVTIE